jgi:phage tail-like protein
VTAAYPLPNYRFQVGLSPSDPYRPASVPAGPQVVLVGAFSDVTGLSGELEVLAHPEGGQNAFVHQLPVRHSWGRLTLKKGVVLDRALWDWFDKGLTGSLGARRDGSVTLLDPVGASVLTWEFRAALAVKWTGPDLSAREGAIAVETLEVVHQGIRQVLAGAV